MNTGQEHRFRCEPDDTSGNDKRKEFKDALAAAYDALRMLREGKIRYKTKLVREGPRTYAVRDDDSSQL